jgi:hypothetical protein
MPDRNVTDTLTEWMRLHAGFFTPSWWIADPPLTRRPLRSGST